MWRKKGRDQCLSDEERPHRQGGNPIGSSGRAPPGDEQRGKEPSGERPGDHRRPSEPAEVEAEQASDPNVGHAELAHERQRKNEVAASELMAMAPRASGHQLDPAAEAMTRSTAAMGYEGTSRRLGIWRVRTSAIDAAVPTAPMKQNAGSAGDHPNRQHTAPSTAAPTRQIPTHELDGATSTAICSVLMM